MIQTVKSQRFIQNGLLKHVNMIETPISAEKSLDIKQQEWMTYFIRQVKGKQLANDINFVNFVHTNHFSLWQINLGFLTGKYGSWIVDTRALVHICSNLDMFKKLTTLSTSTIVHLPDGGMKEISKMRDINFFGLKLKETLFLPAFKYNLLSVSKLSKANSICCLFFSNYCLL